MEIILLLMISLVVIALKTNPKEKDWEKKIDDEL
jgi:hypothetical protein